jgi:hypothetical protein
LNVPQQALSLCIRAMVTTYMFKPKTCDNICMSETLNDKLLEKKRLEQEEGVLACVSAVTQ